MSVSHSKLLTQMSKIDPIFLGFETRLQAYRALRNAIVHIHNEGETPIAVPNDEVVEDYLKIVNYAICPPLAIDSIAIKNVICVEWTNSLIEAHNIMLHKGISLLPIVNQDKIEGIFTSWHLQKYLMTTNSHIQRDTPISVLQTYSGLNRPLPEIWSDFRVDFQKSNVNINEVAFVFSESARCGYFFKAVYLTQNGKPFEKIEGLITPHCLPNINPILLKK
jgi:CBS domain-containing protein